MGPEKITCKLSGNGACLYNTAEEHLPKLDLSYCQTGSFESSGVEPGLIKRFEPLLKLIYATSEYLRANGLEHFPCKNCKFYKKKTEEGSEDDL